MLFFEENNSVSRRLCFKLLFLDTCNLKQANFGNIIRIKLLWKSCLICSDISERDDVGYPRSRSFLIISNVEVSGFCCRICLIFESLQLVVFSTGLQDFVSKIISKSSR